MYYKCLPEQYYQKGKVIDTRNDNYGICDNIDFDVIYNSVQYIIESAKKTNLPVSLFFSLLNIDTYKLTDLHNILSKIEPQRYYKINDLLKINSSTQEIEGKKLEKFYKIAKGIRNTLKLGSQLWENIGEIVRIENFPNMPSRIDSYFLFDDLKSANYYLKEHNKPHIIVEVEILNQIILETFDMSIWDIDNNNVPYSECEANMKCYWESNNASQMIYPEILFQGELKLGKIVS